MGLMSICHQSASLNHDLKVTCEATYVRLVKQEFKIRRLKCSFIVITRNTSFFHFFPSSTFFVVSSHFMNSCFTCVTFAVSQPYSFHGILSAITFPHLEVLSFSTFALPEADDFNSRANLSTPTTQLFLLPFTAERDSYFTATGVKKGSQAVLRSTQSYNSPEDEKKKRRNEEDVRSKKSGA